ncbi:TonB-dependent receptor [Brevundimonas vesicularis]|uniref:TonB-dependent receptor n=1 Tax=Brevundimonas vesicularis TaxID=41276 RepID=UPI0022EC330D|nr:TonB-dependent receptor [Brevundimonas vesicularis]WBT06363.1 TonB-dependent receptor [Brevundimonas vesicularis]
MALLAQGAPVLAQAQTFVLDMPAQDLADALRAVARATRHEIAFESGAVRGKLAPALTGTYTPQAAVAALLAGSGLVVEVGRSGLLIVRPDNRRVPGVAASALSNEVTEISEILVLGSRSLNVDVRRSEDGDQPYVVFNRDEISTSQATTVEEFLRTRLPQNAGFGGSRAQSTGNGRPYSSFNLRGLGANQTLILVNGRRLASLANQNFAPAQADINGIPLGSIERIEILPASAGGVYGGNAVGGVINIILRHDYQGVEVATTYNDTFDFAAPNGRFDVNGGFSLEGGRTTVTFGGSISRSGTLRVRDRAHLIQDGMDLGFRNLSPYDRSGFPPLGNGVNIRSADGSSLVLDPRYGGADLGSAVTHLPLGYGGVDADGGAQLRANAGAFDLDIPDTLAGLERGLLTSPEMQSFNVNVRREFTSWLDGFVDYSRFENAGTSYSANQLPSILSLAADAPTNPFQQAIRLSFPTPGLSFPYESDSKTETLAVGTIIRLPRRWALNLEVNQTRTSNRAVFYQSAIDAYGDYCGLGAADDPFSCAGRPVLDPLSSPIDFGDYLFTEPTYRAGPYDSTFTNPSLRASGPVFRLPGGSATLTLAVQQEATKIERAGNTFTDTVSRSPLYVVFPGRDQRTTSEYAELALPLASPQNNVPFLRELELRAAVRHDAYVTKSPPSGFDSFIFADPDSDLPAFERVESRFESTNYTVAGRYSPFEALVLRASYATGFLPPSVVQLGSQSDPAPFGLGVPDPLRGDEIVDYALTTTRGLGNGTLRPEESETMSFGAIVTPMSGVRLSADYTRIKKTGEIGGIPLDYLLANPDVFPGRVVRAAPASGDPVGYAGRILFVDASPINMLQSEFKAVDVQIDYDRDFGAWGSARFYALATWQPTTVRQLVPGAAALDYTGNWDGPLEWQGNGGVDWEKGAWRIRWNTQFYDSYNIFTTQDATTPGGAASIEDAIALQGARRIPSQTYSDLHVSYAFGDRPGPLGGTRLSAGVLNVFNKTPPVVAITSYTQAGYSTYGDPRLRRFSVSLTKAF